MVKEVKILLPDEVYKLLCDVCLGEDNLRIEARTMFLKAIAAEYMSLGNHAGDEVARQIEVYWIPKLEKL